MGAGQVAQHKQNHVPGHTANPGQRAYRMRRSKAGLGLDEGWTKRHEPELKNPPLKEPPYLILELWACLAIYKYSIPTHTLFTHNYSA